MVGTYPYAIGASVFGVIALLVFALGGDLSGILKKVGAGFQHRLDRADMSIKAEEYALVVLGAGVVLWVALVLLLRQSALISVLLLPLSVALATVAGSFYLKIRGDRRINRFGDQLELVLRMLSGALRVGLGMRQALILVTEEVPDPARREFQRVVGRTNIGVPIADALDELAKNVPSNEMQMFSRVVRVQLQTGGDLARVLEQLAATIRDRRRILRKMKTLTAQGRYGAYIIGALPICVGGFVVWTQPDLGHALLYYNTGHIALGTACGLELAAIFTLAKILQLDV
ncbi:MAG: type II secretion system F family protein [Candidatus Baltobacteraceae bacterium]